MPVTKAFGLRFEVSFEPEKQLSLYSKLTLIWYYSVLLRVFVFEKVLFGTFMGQSYAPPKCQLLRHSGFNLERVLGTKNCSLCEFHHKILLVCTSPSVGFWKNTQLNKNYNCVIQWEYDKTSWFPLFFLKKSTFSDCFCAPKISDFDNFL